MGGELAEKGGEVCQGDVGMGVGKGGQGGAGEGCGSVPTVWVTL